MNKSGAHSHFCLNLNNEFHRFIEESHADLFFFRRTKNGVFDYISPSVTNVLGCSQEKFTSELPALMPDTPTNRVAKNHAFASQKGEFQPLYIVELYHQNGTLRTLEIKETPVFDDNSELIAIEGMASDITERKINEKRNRILFDNAPDPIYTISGIDHSIIEFNKQTLNTYRCKPGDMQGSTPYELSPPTQPDGQDSVSKGRKIISAAIESKTPATFEWQHQRPDGTIFDAEVSLNVLEEKPEVILQAIVRDVTERKRLDKQVQLVNHWIEHSVDLFFWVREDSQVLYVNKATCRILGYSFAELTNMKVSDFDLELPPDAWQKFTDKLRAQGYYSFETRLRSKEGIIFPIEINANYLRFENRDYFFAYGKDIGAKITAEREKKELEQKLLQAKKLEAIGTMAGGIAHDFNNILSAIIGYAELSQLDADSKSPHAAHVQGILKASYRAKNLVQQILTFSRKLEDQQLTPVNLRAAINETIELLNTTLPENITIEMSLLSDSLVIGDTTHIHQIVMNLCSNAIYAMRDKGGVLKINLSDIVFREDFTSKHQNAKPGKHLELTITDEGEGMTPEILERIFDPFYTTKERSKGTGMGLAVVHGSVSALNGIITVSSTPGKGTSCKVFLPAVEGRTADKDTTVPMSPTGKETILFVDDEIPLVEIAKKGLQKFGYKVYGCTDSREALSLFKADPDKFDLVITDLTMPHMTGEALAKEIITTRNDMPIILTTGLKYKITEQTKSDFGIQALLPKPVMLSDLAQAVRDLLTQTG